VAREWAETNEKKTGTGSLRFPFDSEWLRGLDSSESYRRKPRDSVVFFRPEAAEPEADAGDMAAAELNASRGAE